MQYHRYEPCRFAHTPQKLSSCAAWKLANVIISSAVPLNLQVRSIFVDHGDVLSDDDDIPALHSYSLDTIILAEETASEYVKNLHKVFKSQLIKVKKWWDTCEWLGNSHQGITAARQDLQDQISNVLDHKFMHIRCPLLRFTLQLVFTREAGDYSNIVPHGYYEVELSSTGCKQYSLFLEDLGVLGIRRLINKFTLFATATPEPLVIILKNSPSLREVYIRHNSSDYLINFLRIYNPLLEKITIEEVFGRLLVSEDGLYKTFFSGLSKDEVSQLLNSEKNVKTSFPNLTQLDVGKSNLIKHFLCHVEHCYPKIVSFSCSSDNFDADFFVKVSNLLQNSKCQIFNIQDICFGSHCILSLDRKMVWKVLPKIKHITLGMDELHQLSNLPLLIDKTKEFLTFCRFSSLTIHIPFNSLSDEDIEKVLLPIFHLMSPNIKALQFYIQRNVECDLIWKLINACSNLELLMIKLFDAYLLPSAQDIPIVLNSLDDLRSLAINCEDLDLDDKALLDILKEVVLRSKYVKIVEFHLPIRYSRDWFMDISARGFLKNVEILSIYFDYGFQSKYTILTKDDIDIDFYVPVVEGLTSLKKLILVRVYTGILADMKNIFRTSLLNVSAGPQPLVGYYGLCSRVSV